MRLTGICLLFVYAIIRLLPFVITGYMIVGGKNAHIGRRKKIAIFVSLVVNASVFFLMHYLQYHNFVIIGYVKNIGGLNFYHTDVEYFALSAGLAIMTAIVLGIILRTVFCDKNIALGMTKKQQGVVLASGFAAFILVLSGSFAKDYFNSQITITEVCSSNASYSVDGNELVEDYIEIYNKGFLPCQISGLYLSDDAYDLKKMPLDGYVLRAGEMLVMPCVNDINSFTINNSGEQIYLSDETGRILEQIHVKDLDTDTAYTKTNLEEMTWEITKCTPGITYEAAMTELVKVPVLSHAGGFYDAEFDLEIESAPDTAVYYTLDGSVPDEGSYLYENAIHVYDKSSEENVWNSVRNIKEDWESYRPDTTPVAKAFLVRAVAVDTAGNKSDVVTASYFIGQDGLKDKAVLSLVAAPEDLFGGEKGIYVTGDAYDEWYQSGVDGGSPLPNFEQTGKEWEREASFELFEKTENVLQQTVGIRIQGNSTRNAEDKRFNVYTRPEYDAVSFESPLFGGDILPTSLIVHTSFIDALNQELMEDRKVVYQKAKPVSLFLNGEFWYEGFLREKYSRDYFEDYCEIEGSNLILYKGGELEEGTGADRELYREFYDYLGSKDFSEDSAYEELTGKIDVQNYIEYLSAHIYCANMDMNDKKNVVMFRAREAGEGAYNDGRWRFALYDMDAVGWTSLRYYEIEEEAALDSFSTTPRYTKIAFNEGAIYKALKQNEQFSKQFVLTFMDLLNTNFSVENASSKLEAYGQDITWLNSFFEKRPGYMKAYLAKEFGLTGQPAMITIYNSDEQGGTVQVNTITPGMKAGSWSGEYFTDYPVTLTAHPKEGYEFAGWSGSITSDEKMMEVSVPVGGMEITAEFKKIE